MGVWVFFFLLSSSLVSPGGGAGLWSPALSLASAAAGGGLGASSLSAGGGDTGITGGFSGVVGLVAVGIKSRGLGGGVMSGEELLEVFALGLIFGRGVVDRAWEAGSVSVSLLLFSSAC